jgi:uncharacterized protein
MKKITLLLVLICCFGFSKSFTQNYWNLDKSSRKLLDYVGAFNDAEGAQKEIENGANVNAHSNNRCYPIFYAVLYKNLYLVDLLLKNGANPDTCARPHIETRTFVPNQLSIVEFRDKHLLYNPFYYAIKLNQLEMVKKFCEYNYNVKKKIGDSIYTFPIVAAAKYNNSEIFNLLLEEGVDVNVKDCFGLSTLMYCCSANNLQMFQKVIQTANHINDTSNIGYTALMYAANVQGINMNIIDSLIREGADINHFNKLNESALSLACQFNNHALALLLLEHGAIVKEPKSEIEASARMSHFLGDFYLAKGELQIAKDYYVKAQHYYTESIHKEEQELSKVNKEKALDKTIEVMTFAASVAVGQSIAYSKADQFGKNLGMNLTNSQKAILASQYTDEYYRKYSTVYTHTDYASLDEQKTFHQKKIDQFKLCVDLIGSKNNCIDKGLIGDELNSCIRTAQLSQK